MKKKLRLSALILSLTMTMGALTACTNSAVNNPSSSSTGQPVKSEAAAAEKSAGPAVKSSDTSAKTAKSATKDTVIIATADETPSINPSDHNAVAGDYVNKLMYNGLFRLDKELNPIPDLVEDYSYEQEAGSDRYIWTFMLHEGVKFHDGTEMTADDVVACLSNTKNMPEVALYSKQFEEIKKVDDYTVCIITPGPSANLLYDLSHHGNYIVPASFIENGDFSSPSPIGTGPYKFVKWSRGEELQFTANEDYFDESRKPSIKNIVWRIIPEASSRTIALETLEVDYVIELDSTSVKSLESDPNITVMKVPSVSHNWLCLNNTVKPFDDINVRKAINAAIDKESVITVALNGLGIVAKSQTPIGMLGEYTGEFDAYDVELAKEYLKKWGGDPSTITLNIICSDDTKRRAAEVVQANLKEIGIETTLANMDLATYLDVTKRGEFSGFIGGYNSNEMMSFLNGVYHTGNIGASNKTRAGTPEIDALIDKASRTIDQAEREKVLQEVTKILNEACYQIPIYQKYTVSGHNAKLMNTFITSGGSFFVSEWYWAE